MPERPTREEVDDLIVRTREAHEVLKDIKAATKEMKEAIKQADEARARLILLFAEQAHELIETTVEEGLKTWTAAIDEAIGQATEAVYLRFDTIAAIMLGEENDIEESARFVRQTMKKGHVVTPEEQWRMDQMQQTLDRRLGDQLDLRAASLRPNETITLEDKQ